jgi:hypothetical protein
LRRYTCREVVKLCAATGGRVAKSAGLGDGWIGGENHGVVTVVKEVPLEEYYAVPGLFIRMMGQKGRPMKTRDHRVTDGVCLR